MCQNELYHHGIKDSKLDNKSARLAQKIDKVRQKIEKNSDLLNLKI